MEDLGELLHHSMLNGDPRGDVLRISKDRGPYLALSKYKWSWR